MPFLTALLREPLTHFFVIGLLLFAAYAAFDADSGVSDEILVDERRVAVLAAVFEKTWGRPPVRDELDRLIDSWVREEILYREGLAMGFATDDPIVRRRVIQKVNFFVDSTAVSIPGEHELQGWLDTHPDVYRIPQHYALRQVYIDPARHGAALESVIEALRAEMAQGHVDVRGDLTMLPARLDDASEQEVARAFGDEFAAGIADLPLGEWAGPVSSTYGLHLVYIEAAEPGRLPSLDEVRAAVERDWLREKTAQANEAFFLRLEHKYPVRKSAGPDAGDSER